MKEEYYIVSETFMIISAQQRNQIKIINLKTEGTPNSQIIHNLILGITKGKLIGCANMKIRIPGAALRDRRSRRS